MAFIQTNITSKTLSKQVNFNAVIPMGGDKAKRKTLYLLHGLTGNHMDWTLNTRIIHWAEQRNLAVIMPAADNSFYVDNNDTFAKYSAFFGEELVELTRELFPLSHKKEDTYIAGLSMGGYGAIRTGLLYPQTFGKMAGLSSAFVLEKLERYEGSDETSIFGSKKYLTSIFGDLGVALKSDKHLKVLVEQTKAQKIEIPELYFSCGTDDFLIDQNRSFAKFLEEQKITHTYEEFGGGHTWEYWDEHILTVLNWIGL